MKNLKSFAAGFVCAALLSTTAVSALAATGAINISVTPGVSIKVNGQVFKPKTADGKDAMVFVYDGTTYAPLRALAEAYDLEVGWDQAAQMATVGSRLNSNQGYHFDAINYLTVKIGDDTLIESGEDYFDGSNDIVCSFIYGAKPYISAKALGSILNKTEEDIYIAAQTNGIEENVILVYNEETYVRPTVTITKLGYHFEFYDNFRTMIIRKD